jgi:hypothetical protein
VSVTSARLLGAGAVEVSVGRVGRDSHEETFPSSLTGPWLLRPIERKPSTDCLRRGRKGCMLLYPSRPVPDTPGPLSTNLRAGSAGGAAK